MSGLIPVILFLTLSIFLLSSCSVPQTKPGVHNQENEELTAEVDSISKEQTCEAEKQPLFIYKQNTGDSKEGHNDADNMLGFNLENDLRLTGIIQDEKPFAIIEIYGKSYVVQQGDKIEDFYIKDIRENTVVVCWGTKVITLANPPI